LFTVLKIEKNKGSNIINEINCKKKSKYYFKTNFAVKESKIKKMGW